jgi:hypothetical protein
MENNFNTAKEIALLNLYASYLIDSGLDAQVLPAQNPGSLDLLQIKLVDGGNLNILFVPLGEGNFQTLSLLQFYAQWDSLKRNELDSLRLINALNQKLPVSKVSLNEESTLEYHYYLPVPTDEPLTKEAFLERVSLILSQIETIYEIWLSDAPVSVLIQKLQQE